MGGEIDIRALDGFYAMAHTWVGNQAGMFASRRAADFDLFTYRDGFTEIPAAEANQSSADVVASESAGRVLGGLEDGDHAMFGAVDLGSGGLESGAMITPRLLRSHPAVSGRLSAFSQVAEVLECRYGATFAGDPASLRAPPWARC